MNRTPDLLITNELLYRLSYTGWCFKSAIIARELGLIVVTRHQFDFVFRAEHHANALM